VAHLLPALRSAEPAHGRARAEGQVPVRGHSAEQIIQRGIMVAEVRCVRVAPGLRPLKGSGRVIDSAHRFPPRFKQNVTLLTVPIDN
jgi:hypothetical protein